MEDDKIEIYDRYISIIYRILCICPYRIAPLMRIMNETEHSDLKQNLQDCYDCSLCGKNRVNSEILYRSLVRLYRHYDSKKRKELKKKLRLKVIE